MQNRRPDVPSIGTASANRPGGSVANCATRLRTFSPHVAIREAAQLAVFATPTGTFADLYPMHIMSIASPGLGEGPSVMRTVSRNAERHLGVYCETEQAGIVREDDLVMFEPPLQRGFIEASLGRLALQVKHQGDASCRQRSARLTAPPPKPPHTAAQPDVEWELGCTNDLGQ
ncbi:hypothetical protein [Antrihabitans spumae]|uniref:Uncharacterized protein n=1 Tax=Antrihabitans spumae TaxID=3373370 RepID=A0ABW7KUE7_9NOCA